MRTPGFLVLALAGAIAAASCGGGGGSTPTSPSNAGGNGTTGGGSNGGGSTPNVVTITIKGQNGKQSFDPNPAPVNTGETVVFKNSDNTTHHIVLDDGSMQTADIPPGGTSAALPLGGVNKSYHCTIHPSMVGSFNGAAIPDPPSCQGYCGG
jgi:plastocyanin